MSEQALACLTDAPTYEHPAGFVPCTDRYGMAEFAVCAVWKRRRLVDLFVYPRQQPDAQCYWHITDLASDSLVIQSWEHEGMEPPRVWMQTWCVEHRGPSLWIYPPKQARSWHLLLGSTAQLIFDHRAGCA